MLHSVGLVDLPIVRVQRLGRGCHEIAFEDPDDVISNLELEFTNRGGHGEAAKWARAFADAQRNLKSIMRTTDAHTSQGGYVPGPAPSKHSP